MTLTILKPGPQTTVQAGPREGYRHLGVPTSGPADRLSHALANRLVGNGLLAPTLEITLGPFEAVAEADMSAALTGAEGRLSVDDQSVPFHRCLMLRRGQTLRVGHPHRGCRTYLSVAGGFEGACWLGSMSTYLPAGVGGFSGRALRAGDRIGLAGEPSATGPADETPAACRPPLLESWALRAVRGPDVPASSASVLDTGFVLSRRSSRMGGALEGQVITADTEQDHPSSAVFPGTVQCPPDGRPFLLGVDAQTTGGYPNMAQVIRADRHLIGQIRPGDRVRFLETTPEAAADALRKKTALFTDWLGCAFDLG